jgi:hypothetical protein
MEGGKLIMGLKIIVNQWIFGYGIRKIFSLRFPSLLLSYNMDMKFGDAVSLES